ncbi:uncharacterized protein V1516DRAFT_667744 [Lipomyces oligophaga]|uniref:uncharacterized protein n=1 Tax=Lipomyces oligophaga TaxID=45792 RepID=UPI0034CF5B2C
MSNKSTSSDFLAKNTQSAEKKVSTVSSEATESAKKTIKDATPSSSTTTTKVDEAVDSVKKAVEDATPGKPSKKEEAEKEIKEAGEKIKKAVQPAVDALKKFISNSREFSVSLAVKTKTELANPVVSLNLIGWTALIAASLLLFKKGKLPLKLASFPPAVQHHARYFKALAATLAIVAVGGEAAISKQQYPKYRK